MKIHFTKMHGLGNDYIYVDCISQTLTGIDRPSLARAVSDRHRGVGSDGLILICRPAPDVDADCRMEMYNADGSRGEMCGNGIRCVAKYVVDRGLVSSTNGGIRIQTDRGVLDLRVMLEGGLVRRVRVDMGPPILEPGEIPVRVAGSRCVRQPLAIEGHEQVMTCVSMGNPHAVFFVEDLGRVGLERLGPAIERHPLFPNRVNAHFVAVQGRGEATMRTWERGSGVTQACGTGACAVLVAGVLEGRLDRSATIHLPGGDLLVEWPDAGNASVFMTGPAEEVFSGEWEVESGS